METDSLKKVDALGIHMNSYIIKKVFGWLIK